MHCTRVVGCQEVVIACSRGLRPRTVGCAARFERIVQDTGHFLMTTGDVFSCVRDGYYTVCNDSVRRVWSSSPGFRLNHEDSNNNSSISYVGTYPPASDEIQPIIAFVPSHRVKKRQRFHGKP